MILYTGITIGPIFDTISRATVPSALWFSSILFSDLNRRLCKGITASIPDAKIISPFYEENASDENDGVGVYHDRIIFSVDTDVAELEEKLGRIIAQARGETAEQFPDTYITPSLKAFLDSYLEIHYVILPQDQLENTSSVLAISPYLDALELMKTFPSCSLDDPFVKLFANDDSRPGSEESRNEAIRKSPLFPRNKKHYLVNRNSSIRSVSEIAANRGDRSMKHTRYFAVVNADGDSMGKFLEKLADEDVAKFSRACLQYAREASDLIAEFGGMPIYAGGDDLLFLAPVCGQLDGKACTVIDLCQTIHTRFSSAVESAFSGDTRSLSFPTLSFGVSVQYEKFPLYEALSLGRDLLSAAKNRSLFRDEENNAIKDNIALNVQKHSGQTFGIIIHNPEYEAFHELALAADGADAPMVNSVLYTTGLFSPLLQILISETAKDLNSFPLEELEVRFLSVWNNLFDNPNQSSSRACAKSIGKTFFQKMVRENNRLCPLKLSEASDSTSGSLALDSLRSVLNWVKFLNEKAGEDE